MKTHKLGFTIFLMSVFSTTLPLNGVAQNETFNLIPDFQFSESGKYGTGLGIADMNNDGWQDIVIANGNDMSRKKVEIYYNQGDGTFNQTPDWESSDIDYHGHLAIGDLDKNGRNDIVVSVYIGEGGFSSPGKLKIYYNYESGTETEPSFVSEPFYTFSCALGDADNDGDLDIAATGGESYNNRFDQGRIFINNEGQFTDTANWKTNDTACSYDVDFADFNGDGKTDIVYANTGFTSKIYLGDSTGMISPEPAWENSDNNILANSLDVGFIDSDNHPDLVFTNNNQSGNIDQVYTFLFDQQLMNPTGIPNWQSNSYEYLSGVYLYDVDYDSNLDLVYGGWWNSIRINSGTDTAFELEPIYTSDMQSVVEAFAFSDLGKENEKQYLETYIIERDSVSFIYLNKKPVEEIIEVKVNSQTINRFDYCFVPGKNWISLKNKLTTGDNISIVYEHSPNCDMIVSNWDTKNHIYYNQADNLGSLQINKNEKISIYPNPANQHITIRLQDLNQPQKAELINIQTGRIVCNLTIVNEKTQISVKEFPAGVYMLKISGSAHQLTKRIIIL